MKAGEGYKFYGKPDGKAVIFALPFEPAAEAPDEEYDLSAIYRTRPGALAHRQYRAVCRNCARAFRKRSCFIHPAGCESARSASCAGE
ncbi:hypothetical protein ACLB1E_17210 [Escherichia coli]